MNSPDESSSSQLWEPFISSRLNSIDSTIEDVPVKSIVKALKKYYSHVTSLPFGRSVVLSFRDNSSSSESISFLTLVEVMKEHTENPTCAFIDPKYAVININDIVRQVGPVQSITSSVYHSVISPYFVFNNNFADTVGNIINL
ncbi:hypothetical protein BDF21DRAFT_461751 [Thamnidium elegans]|uniref:Uncharacterized protein n=1 Tax=Thamnidium elegans TaxID=101142 RepID=A0A8H7SGW5_9FUNG|nr:hypothetical protein INT48_001416 [Thamnidium elegans]KAI8083545.1 hypothetical protein BDF21DRAFT_461751 [Thamnidium elegans]